MLKISSIFQVLKIVSNNVSKKYSSGKLLIFLIRASLSIAWHGMTYQCLINKNPQISIIQ